MSNDLGTLEIGDAAAKMELVHPISGEIMTYTKDGIEHSMTISFYALESSVGKAAQNARINARFKRGLLGNAKNNLAQVADEESLRILATLAAEWDGDGDGKMPYKGESYAFTPGNVTLLFSHLPWLKAQSDKFVNDLSNYVGN